LGTGLIFSVPYGILALIAGCMLGHPLIGAAVLAWSVANRVIESLLVGWAITHDPPCLYQPWLYPIRDLIGFAVWVASYTSTQLAWRERSFELMSDGRISVHDSKQDDVAPR
jgi:hypothetical protein